MATSGTKRKASRRARIDNLKSTMYDVPMKDIASAVNGVILPPSISETSDVQVKTPKGKKKMSTENAAPATDNKVKKSVKFFDLSTGKEGKKEYEFIFNPSENYADAMTRVQAIANSEKLILAALNSVLESSAASEAKKTAIPENGVSKKAVLEFLKPFRNIPPYSADVTKEKGQDGWKEQYNKQTDHILADAIKNEFMLNAMKAAASVSSTDDSDEDESEEKNA